ncbi:MULTISPECIES: acyl-CoA thioesterase [Clostridium]|uniref:Predicted esterase n=1 Tax=Clostridium acetobutylicum (strain ATCC 824 / DSM 792 / JCM 1419 / IAM 19013 / LMG 5710 / NBRC 13948 / NRRL B-527 / VKM B-1787 / 2291 / W) TaxID=272562 RepID=Q97MC7_CLOAB|nr:MULTISPECIES: thioesterase family protein [Clostridium]AAK78252.1 Predicted esterase [Clostridium acetobutylicum ATCC 824]ADZ19318.1 esterase [Clostridium acetobutylicum EA 2018]AEI33889.1 esterase [Clostridium acetobutylicum DSM 1731]AWV82059.1 acyl-CoA thioesterase [Clostridium acetobutylicum]MBC2396149.1 acyl-CoA thioesterase [Clostridium acetobutylicum]
MNKAITRIKVRYAETDKMGIVYHANYYVYFEAAREDLIEGAGIKYSDMEDIGIMMPLVETKCKYHEGAKYGDYILVETTLGKLSPIKVEINYRVLRESDGKLLAEGQTTQVFVDAQNFKIIKLMKSYPEVWEKLQKIK